MEWLAKHRREILIIGIPVAGAVTMAAGIFGHHYCPTSLWPAFVLHTGYFAALLGVGGLIMETQSFRVYFEGITKRMLESIVQALMTDHAYLAKLSAAELLAVRKSATKVEFAAALAGKCDQVVDLLEREIFQKLGAHHFENYRIFLDQRVIRFKGQDVIESTQTMSFVLVSSDANERAAEIPFSTGLDKIQGLDTQDLLSSVLVLDSQDRDETARWLKSKGTVDTPNGVSFNYEVSLPVDTRMQIKLVKRTPLMDTYSWRASLFCSGLEIVWTHDERIRPLKPPIHAFVFSRPEIASPNAGLVRGEVKGWVLPGQGFFLDWTVV